jgi:hypothetical protein
MDDLWTSPLRHVPATLLAAAGAWLLATGLLLGRRGLLLASRSEPGGNWLLMRGIRRLTQGAALAAIGLGWTFQWPVAIAAGLLFGFEELIETSIAAAALRDEAERESAARAGSPRA